MSIRNLSCALLAVAIAFAACSQSDRNQQEAAIGNLIDLWGAQAAYHAKDFKYATTVDELIKEDLLGNWSELQNGYRFSMTSDSRSFSANADPVEGEVGLKAFFVDQWGKVRFDATGPAAATSAEIPKAGQGWRKLQ